jgi:hypothetical protein
MTGADCDAGQVNSRPRPIKQREKSGLAGLVTLTMVLAGYFIVHGVLQIVAALRNRTLFARSWPWMVVNGVADWMLAAIIIAGWPGSVRWALGLLVGINLFLSGLALVMAACLPQRRPRTEAGGAGRSRGLTSFLPIGGDRGINRKSPFAHCGFIDVPARRILARAFHAPLLLGRARLRR